MSEFPAVLRLSEERERGERWGERERERTGAALRTTVLVVFKKNTGFRIFRVRPFEQPWIAQDSIRFD